MDVAQAIAHAAAWRARRPEIDPEPDTDMVGQGFVVIHEADAWGTGDWTLHVDRPGRLKWVPGCVAVGVDGAVYRAVGGGYDLGALRWKLEQPPAADAKEPTREPAPAIQWRADAPPRDGRTVLLDYELETRQGQAHSFVRAATWWASCWVGATCSRALERPGYRLRVRRWADVPEYADTGKAAGREAAQAARSALGELEASAGGRGDTDVCSRGEIVLDDKPEPPPRTNEETLALLRLGLEPQPVPGPYRAVEDPDNPGLWRILGPERGQILAVLPGLGLHGEQTAATARLMAAGWTLLTALRGQQRQHQTCPCGTCDVTREAIARAEGKGCTVDAAAGTFLCHSCGWISHHPQDVAQRYCGHCHTFHGEPSDGKEAPR